MRPEQLRWQNHFFTIEEQLYLNSSNCSVLVLVRARLDRYAVAIIVVVANRRSRWSKRWTDGEGEGETER